MAVKEVYSPIKPEEVEQAVSLEPSADLSQKIGICSIQERQKQAALLRKLAGAKGRVVAFFVTDKIYQFLTGPNG